MSRCIHYCKCGEEIFGGMETCRDCVFQEMEDMLAPMEPRPQMFRYLASQGPQMRVSVQLRPYQMSFDEMMRLIAPEHLTRRIHPKPKAGGWGTDAVVYRGK